MDALIRTVCGLVCGERAVTKVFDGRWEMDEGLWRMAEADAEFIPQTETLSLFC